MQTTLDGKIEHARRILRELGSVVVAYSGGVDSAVVLALAHRELGEKALACIGVSPSFPTREKDEAIALAQQLGAAWRTINTEEYEVEGYQANAGNRCFYCKSDLYDRIARVAANEKWGAIVDGTNADDLSDDRPGLMAARNHGVRSVLVEAGIGKAEVRAIAHELGLAVWDKPAMACLSSRVPAGTRITPAILQQIERAEYALADLGFRQYRVRHHDTVARIELRAEDFARAVELRSQLVAALRAVGYKHVALDLSGFRTEGDLEAAMQLVNLNVGEKT